jgi:hypothetical protein
VLLSEGMKWQVKAWFHLPFHTFTQQRDISHIQQKLQVYLFAFFQINVVGIR